MRAHDRRTTKTVLTAAAASLILLVVLLILLLGRNGAEPSEPSWMPPADESADEPAAPSGNGEESAQESGGDSSSGSGYAPWLSNPDRFAPVSGEFDLGSVANDAEVALEDVADEYSSVTAAIMSVDSSFEAEGYMVRAHAGNASGGGEVRATLYIGDIMTSSVYVVNIDSGTLRYVDILSVYHPTAEEIEAVKQIKADFEASPASKLSIESARSGLWPKSDNGVETSFSEYYFYSFQTGRMYLYVSSTHSYNSSDGIEVSDIREDKIDCLAVLGR